MQDVQYGLPAGKDAHYGEVRFSRRPFYNNILIGIGAKESLLRTGENEILFATETQSLLISNDELFINGVAHPSVSAEAARGIRNAVCSVFNSSSKKAVVNRLELLSAEDRIAVLNRFCQKCGKSVYQDGPCYCVRD